MSGIFKDIKINWYPGLPPKNYEYPNGVCVYCNDDVKVVSDCYYEVRTNNDEVLIICEGCFVDKAPFMKGMKIGNQQIVRVKCINL